MKNKTPSNPFEYEAAVKFADDELIEYFVEDHNYSRFIQSERNIFLVGERGCGKSMMLLYNSYQKQIRKAEKENYNFDYDRIGVYIPCTNTLFFKTEYELINNAFKVSVLSEHFLVLAMAYELADVLSKIPDLCSKEIGEHLKADFKYILNIDLPNDSNLFNALKKYLQKLNTEIQHQINNTDESISDKCVSFYSFILPFLSLLKDIEKIKETHFLFLIDDAHDLNAHQIKALNSWIAYRNHTDFSFKVAVAKVKTHTYKTASGGAILEGHDFLKIDMEKPFQNKFTDFGQWAKDIVERRLIKFGFTNTNPELFFPVNSSFETELKKCEETVRKEAEVMYMDDLNKTKKITDYVYKYARAEYFRNRSSKANLPPYSGWDTLVHLSTGVIRNLLYPCYWMYDKEYSTLSDTDPKSPIEKLINIRPGYQDEIIKEKSQELWNKIENDLFNNIDCSTKQALQIKNLFENLVLLFKERLLSPESSEPRAITFSISARSEMSDEKNEELNDLLRISKEAQILYERTSSGKEAGQREKIYVPNRLLLPTRGLDVIGQHSRVSIKAKELYDSATRNAKINFKEVIQKTLFDLYEY